MNEEAGRALAGVDNRSPRFPHGMTPVTDRDLLAQIRSDANRMVEYPADISLEWVLAKQWAVVPLADQPDLRECEWICNAAQDRNLERCIILVTETSDSDSTSFVTMQTTILHQALHWEHFSLSNLVLFPLTLDFMVVKESADYFLIAGPRRFVERALGASMGTARQRFDDAAERTIGDTGTLRSRL